MASIWERIVLGFDRFAPEGTTKRKMIQLLSIILVIEGISVLLLFSYQGALVGILSMALGILLLLIMYPGWEEEGESKAETEAKGPPPEPTVGVKLVDWFMATLRSDYVVMALGVLIVGFVLLYNIYLSSNPKIGDFDTLAIMLGGMIVVYPLSVPKFKTESAFALLFLGLVVVILVIPDVVMAISSGTGTSVGDTYVHYMLAAPFAYILDLIGIPASSSGNSVTMILQSGDVLSLGISAYCAGLYSFTIFVSAFIAFVLVFERLPRRTTALVLVLGLIAAYLGNLFRMVVIGVVGYFNGIDALLWAHKNVGWIIFLSWSAVFWYLVMRYANRRSTRAVANRD
jgi:archaeosortase C (PEF-CTERM variant)